ncbi:hypothetical protein OK016_21290 [Vibrio chagasii]|nr:hypothetical protein [Vibrio chagasii]
MNSTWSFSCFTITSNNISEVHILGRGHHGPRTRFLADADYEGYEHGEEGVKRLKLRRLVSMFHLRQLSFTRFKIG